MSKTHKGYPPLPYHLSWIICPWNKARWMIFPYANLHIVSKLHVKFHWNLLSSVGGDALTSYVDRRTDRQTGWFLYTPPNYVCGGYNDKQALWDCINYWGPHTHYWYIQMSFQCTFGNKSKYTSLQPTNCAHQWKIK